MKRLKRIILLVVGITILVFMYMDLKSLTPLSITLPSIVIHASSFAIL